MLKPTQSGRAEDGTAFEVYGSNGAPVVALIHGLGLCRHLWTEHLPALAVNHRVVNYDLYGHGDSVTPSGEASLTLYSDQLANLLDELEIATAAVVGFSIGGMINRRFVLDHRDRLWALAILNSPHDRGEDAQTAVEERASQVRAQGAMATMDAALVRWFTPGYLESDAAGPALVREWRGLVDPEGYAQAAWVLAHGVRELLGPNPPMDVPTLVMTGERDSGSTPDMAYSIAAEIPGAETIVVPHLQHLGIMEQPSLFTEPILAFLDQSRPSL